MAQVKKQPKKSGKSALIVWGGWEGHTPILDCMIAFHDASDKGQHVTLESTCSRPAPLSMSLLRGTLD